MIGKYINGVGKGHKNNLSRANFFNCPMYGTFNIKINEPLNLSDKTPYISKHNTEYYLVKITKDSSFYYGYLVHWKKSQQLKNIIEIVSKELLPEHLKEGELHIEIMDKWSDEEIDNWAKDRYQWQGFDWLPVKRANSSELSNAINRRVYWSGKRVLDFGSNYGYHSFNASKKGAIVTGVEINNSAREQAQIINDHIEMQDVKFYKTDKPEKKYDIILYLSVHHQIDPDYNILLETLLNYKKRCNTLVTELIMPPMFGKGMTVEEIDKKVGGEVLMNYKHPVRGIRRLYIWEEN